MISVVIPTLGQFDINNLKYQIINNTEKIKFEIIFCIPKKYYSNLTRLIKYKNIKIVKSKNFNQVKQRIEGVKFAKYNNILQLDDDIILSECFLTNIFNSSKIFKGNYCVSPIFRDIKTKKIVYRETTILKRILYFVLFQIDFNKMYGRISNFGLAFDFSPNYKNVQKVEWLPGGCMLTQKKYYQFFNTRVFQNFEKSYYEDVYFSLKSKFPKYLDYRNNAFLKLSNSKENLLINLKYLNLIYRLKRHRNLAKYMILVVFLCIKNLISIK
tara:strand:+ start:1481 stop:2290 length:810 start_codon:yes stop_codon:yes gene_type:complete